jgi:hypothetical protein
MEEEEVITNFTDSESDNDNNSVLKTCCLETDHMIETMKQEAKNVKHVVSSTKTTLKSDRYDLKVNPETRKILAKKLEDYLDDQIEIVEGLDIFHTDISSRQEPFRLLSDSHTKFNDETFVDSYQFTVKRKSIPLHKVEPQKLTAAISPRFDISNILSELQHVQCDVIL